MMKAITPDWLDNTLIAFAALLHVITIIIRYHF
jgi:hypothetical protein